MVKEGRIIYCDRCGVSTFEHLNKAVTEWSHMPTYHHKDYMTTVGGKDLCPHCYAVYNTMIQRFMDGKHIDIPEVESRPSETYEGGDEE